MATKTAPTFADELEAKYGKFMTYSDVARELAISVRTAKRITADGHLPCYNIGRRRSLRLKTSDVAALVEQVA